MNGELDLSTAAQLEGPLEEAVASPSAAVLIDLTDCTFIDSTGIALIVRAWQKLEGDGGKGRFVLCCINHQVRRLLKITGVESSISMHQGRDAALAELRG